MKSHFRSFGLVALVGAAALAASTSTANAAFIGFNITADNGTLETIITSPSIQLVTTDLGPFYTVAGPPDVTVGSNNAITFNFDNGLSPGISAAARGIIIQQALDGHLVIDVHFDEPVSLVATISEAGVFTTTGDGQVGVVGGTVVLEAVNPLATETHAADLDTTIGNGAWSATATTAPFNNFFTDYQIVIDNDLFASAITGSSSISKMAFMIQIVPTPVPEPAALSLLGLAAPTLLLRRRRP
ncbi:MAG: PEP-CTERM sorting domain-containing protein [Phycisphaerales bacterium]|nr:PEP-CTERM sorting domain-containing protein [Phycisphaerales bacterium]